MLQDGPHRHFKLALQRKLLTIQTPKQKFILQNYFNNQKEVQARFEQYLGSEKITEFNPVHVIHCPQSFGIVIKHESGVKISYSGDTRPCP